MWSPSSLLLPYQNKMRRLLHNNRLCHFLCSRQIGKSFLLAYLSVEQCFVKSNSLVVLLSSGERSAIELMQKVKKLSDIFCMAFRGTPAEAKYEASATEVRFSNGSRILCLPSNKPETVRGYSPNLVICDEFSTLERQEELYNAIFPSITSPFGGEKKFIISGTPLGKQNLFWKLWEEDNDYAKFKLTIYDARDNGLDVDIDFLRKNSIDEESFMEEYCCVPQESNTSLFPIDLLNRCVYHDVPRTRRRYLGIDIGRVHDLTAIATIVEDTGTGKLYEESVETMKNAEYSEQSRRIREIIKFVNPEKVCIDSTGIGNQLAEDLWKDYGQLVEPCQFTNQFKIDIFGNVKKHMGNGEFFFRDEDGIKEEFAAIKRVARENGITYQADRTSKGHVDKATSIALGVHAADLCRESASFMPISF